LRKSSSFLTLSIFYFRNVVTEIEFREFFEQFGAVMDSVVMFDRDTHRSRGFGFVTFEDPTVCNRLLEMNDSGEGVGRLVMRGKTCEVKAAQPKESSMRGVAKYSRHSNMGGRGPRGSFGAVQNKPFTPLNSTPQAAFQAPSNLHLNPHTHSMPYMQDPNMHASMMYASGHYGQYSGGSVYYPTAGYMTPMYYQPNVTHGTGAAYDASSYMNGAHLNLPEVAESRTPSGPSHHPSMPLQHSVAQQQAVAYVPYNVPSAYVGYPSSVMQPLAPGLPTRPEESIDSADGTPENGQHNRE
jgi:hypothetical protein